MENPSRQDVNNVVKAYTTRKKKTNIICHSSQHKDNIRPWCESLFKTTLPDHEEILEKFMLKTLLQSSWTGIVKFVMDLRLGRLLSWKVFAMQEPMFYPQHPREKAVLGSHPSQYCRGGERVVSGSCCLAQIPERDFATKTTAVTTTKNSKMNSDWGPTPMLTSDLHTEAHTCAHTTLPHTQKNIAKDLKPKKRTEEQTKKKLRKMWGCSRRPGPFARHGILGAMGKTRT